MSLFNDINNNLDLLNDSSNNSFSNSINTNIDFLFLNNYLPLNLNNIEILYPSPINSNDEEESIKNIKNNFNINIINTNFTKLTNSLNNNSGKIFSVIYPKKSNLRDNKNSQYIKKGKKNKNLNRKTHTGFDNDNILRKIQIHFITFIIFFCNDVISNLINEKKIQKFQDIDHQLKRCVNHRKIEWFKNLTLGKIIQLKLSPKIRRYDINVNINIYNEVCQHYPFIQNFFKIKYSDLFKEYYNNKTKLFNVNGTIIHLSEKTKTFNDLINKKKNYNYKQKFQDIAINHFLKCHKRIKKPHFKTSIRNY